MNQRKNHEENAEELAGISETENHGSEAEENNTYSIFLLKTGLEDTQQHYEMFIAGIRYHVFRKLSWADKRADQAAAVW